MNQDPSFFTCSHDLGEGFSPIRPPFVPGRVEVALCKVVGDRVAQLLDAGKAAMADDIDSQVAEEALDHVHPRAAGRRKVHVEPRVLGQPCPNLRMLVGRVVVDDQVQGHITRALTIDVLQKPQPFNVRVSGRRLADNLAVEIRQCGEKGERAVPNIVVCLSADMPHPQRQPGLRSLQSLALTLLVAAQNQRFFGRIEVEADDVPELRLKVRIPRKFEGSPDVGLDVVAAPEGLDMALRHSGMAGHRADAPLSPTGGRLSHLGEHLVDGIGGEPHGPTAASRVLQAGHAEFHEPPPPLAHRLFRNLKRVGDGLIRLASRGQEDNPATSHRRSRRAARPHRTAELVGLLRGQGNRRRNSRHPRRIPSDLNNVKHLAVSTLAHLSISLAFVQLSGVDRT